MVQAALHIYCAECKKVRQEYKNSIASILRLALAQKSGNVFTVHSATLYRLV